MHRTSGIHESGTLVFHFTMVRPQFRTGAYANVDQKTRRKKGVMTNETLPVPNKTPNKKRNNKKKGASTKKNDGEVANMSSYQISCWVHDTDLL